MELHLRKYDLMVIDDTDLSFSPKANTPLPRRRKKREEREIVQTYKKVHVIGHLF